MTHEDPRRIEVWVAMADHFLDTETRHEIPLTAMRCVEAGLTPAEAADVWRYEVSPAVGFNLRDVAGEWAGWDREWLVERIAGLQKGWMHRSGTRRLLQAFGVCPVRGVWVSVERCMNTLLALPVPGLREQTAKELRFLARHYFDFCPESLASLEPSSRERVCSLYPEPFQHVMETALVSGEAFAADRRVRGALKKPLRDA